MDLEKNYNLKNEKPLKDTSLRGTFPRPISRSCAPGDYDIMIASQENLSTK